MNSKVRHVLVMAFCDAYAQQSETTDLVQNGVVKDIEYAKEKGAVLQQD